MKKITTLSILMLISFIGNAEDVYKLHDGKQISRQLIDIPASILAVYIISIFLINIIKGILNHRLKYKMIDKGVSEDMIKLLLQHDQSDTKNQTIKSVFILTGLGIGITITSFFQPYDIHSAVILIFSLSLSFLAYYFYIKRTQK
ncbi:hypothetical protein GCM10027049_18990 [Mucilaginibacter puniceus]